MNILLISAYPPPIGGVTVHVQRLLSLLHNTGHHAQVLDYLNDKDYQKDRSVVTLPHNLVGRVFAILHVAQSTPGNTIVHFHVSAFGKFKWIGPLLSFLFWRQLKIITIHSGSFVVETNKPRLRSYIRWLLCRFSHIITVNVEQAEYLKNLGIKHEAISVIPAFLPTQAAPDLLPEIVARIPRDKTIVLTSGYLTKLYNYDVLIDCIENLDKQKFVFIFAFYNEFDPPYEAYIYQRLSKLENIIILRDQPPDVFVTVMERCNIYVRATIADGDAVAIREAIHFEKSVFASDCVRRPDECFLFPQADFSALLALFHQYQSGKLSTKKVTQNSNISQILKVYQSVLHSDK